MEPPVAASAPTSTSPAPAPAASAPAPEAASRETFERDIGTNHPDALVDLMPAWTPPRIAAKGFTPPKAAAPAPTPVPVVEVPTPPAAPTPAVEPVAAPSAAPEPGAELPKNWRVQAKDAKEALMLALMRNNGATAQEAYAEVYGTESAAPAAAPAPTPSPSAPEPDPVQVADQQITSLATQVADLETQIDAAAESGDTKTALKLTRQQADLKISLDRTRASREATAQQIHDQRVNAAVENHRALEQQSITEAMTAYPDLADKTGEKRAAFNAKVQALMKDPSFGPRFREQLPGWPLMVARLTDVEQGWSRTPVAPVAPVPAASAAPTMTTPAAAPVLTPQPSPAAPSQVPPPRASAAALISPSESHGGTAPTLDAKSFWKDSDQTDPAVLIELMGRAPVDPRLLRAQRLDPRRF